MFNKNKKNKNENAIKQNTNDVKITKDEVKEKIVKNKKITKIEEKVIEKKDQNILLKGSRSIKDFIAPSIDRSQEDHLTVSSKKCRSFVVNGFPSLVSVGWMDDLYNFNGDMDTSLFIVPSDERGALDELTNKITQFEAQLLVEQEKGNIRNITRYRDMIDQLYSQRRALEQNYENLFHIQIVSTLYENSLENLEKQTTRLINKTKGKRIDISPLYLRQEDGYKSTIPIGEMYVKDKLRNFNTGALTACFPFYNSEISHKNGVFLGINMSTITPVLLDFYDTNILNNSNINVFGQAGSGKSFFISLLTLRSCLNGIRTAIIDPEGEYKNITQKVGGAYIKISTNSTEGINPFDLEAEFDEETKQYKVDIKSKISDVLNLVAIMVGGLDKETQSVVANVIGQLYYERGITEDPDSLLQDGVSFDEKTGQIEHNKKKDMPIISDLYNSLKSLAQKEGSLKIKELANSLIMYVKGGIYDLFDRQTSYSLTGFGDRPIITFDVSALEENILRPIGMYIALTWIWERFIKKDHELKKRVICDEAWMLVNSKKSGSEYTTQFLENCARRIRKRKGGLLIASQNFIEFFENSSGKSILTNAKTTIFLSQSPTDIDLIQETFKLSDGEKGFLLQAKRGEMLLKCNGESSVMLAYPFKYEKDLISKKI